MEVRRLLEAGRLTEANVLFDKVVGHNEAAADPGSPGVTAGEQGVIAWRLGRIPLALELAAEGWTDLRCRQGRAPAAANSLGQLGYLLEGLGNRRAALETMRTVGPLRPRRRGYRRYCAHSLQRLGGTLNFRAIEAPPNRRTRGVRGGARRCWPRASGSTWNRRMHRALLGAYGRSLAGLGELTAAAEAGRQVMRLGIESDDLWAIAVGEWVLAIVEPGPRKTRRGADVGRARGEPTPRRSTTRHCCCGSPPDLADICAELDDPVGEAAALRRSVSAARKPPTPCAKDSARHWSSARLAAAAQRMAMAAQEAAARDPLTGLANRLGLERSAPAMLASARRRGRTPWLVLVDVDWFKGVNDDAGHAAGDAALREIAQLIRHECRSDDLVARWAGDEFVVLLGDASGDRDAGPVVAERIRAAVAGHDWTMVLGAARARRSASACASGRCARRPVRRR